MTKITLDVLAQKLDNIQSSVNEIRSDVKENTQFRLQAKGALTVVIMIATITGAGLSWILNKIMR